MILAGIILWVVLIVVSNQSAHQKRDVAQFVYACVTSKSSKAEH